MYIQKTKNFTSRTSCYFTGVPGWHYLLVNYRCTRLILIIGNSQVCQGNITCHYFTCVTSRQYLLEIYMYARLILPVSALQVWYADITCSSWARAVNSGIRSDFKYSVSTALAKSPSFPAAARRTIGVSSPPRFLKCLVEDQSSQWGYWDNLNDFHFWTYRVKLKHWKKVESLTVWALLWLKRTHGDNTLQKDHRPRF